MRIRCCMRWSVFVVAVATLAILATASTAQAAQVPPVTGYSALLALFDDWRVFEKPPLRGTDENAAHDFTAATVARRHAELAGYRARLAAIDTTGWSIEQRIDLELVRAEMNGFDFDVRVLQPWVRDPAYYATVWAEQSDTPAHEGPTIRAHPGEVVLLTIGPGCGDERAYPRRS